MDIITDRVPPSHEPSRAEPSRNNPQQRTHPKKHPPRRRRCRIRSTLSVTALSWAQTLTPKLTYYICPAVSTESLLEPMHKPSRRVCSVFGFVLRCITCARGTVSVHSSGVAFSRDVVCQRGAVHMFVNNLVGISRG